MKRKYKDEERYKEVTEVYVLNLIGRTFYRRDTIVDTKVNKTIIFGKWSIAEGEELRITKWILLYHHLNNIKDDKPFEGELPKITITLIRDRSREDDYGFMIKP